MANLHETGCSYVDEDYVKTTPAEFYKITKEQWTGSFQE